MNFILAIDQGTTGSQALMFRADNLQLLAQAKTEFPQIYPQTSWVEHSPHDIWNSLVKSILKCFESLKSQGFASPENNIVGIGITNQRETLVSWHKETLKPLANAIVWQDKRTAAFCENLKQLHEEVILHKTGLTIDPYFSSSKMNWLLKHNTEVAAAATEKKLQFGTVDSFLVHILTNGGAHITDHTNASRTQLYNLHTQNYDEGLLKLFEIPFETLPKICASLNSNPLAFTKPLAQQLESNGFLKSPLKEGTPIFGILGDQQSALFGQNCTLPGESKITFGTGSFLLLNVGVKPLSPPKGMLGTVAMSEENASGKVTTTYAFEGSCFIAGAAVQFLRDNFQWLKNSAEIEELANKDSRDNSLIFVPALAGLGAPYWNAQAKGTLFGLTRGSTKSQIARCVVESIALQNASLVKTMREHFEKLTEQKLKSSKIGIDGGASQNNSLMQFQANVLQVKLERPKINEATGLGAAKLVFEALNKKSQLKEVLITQEIQNSAAKNFEPKENLSALLTNWERAAQAVNLFYKT